MRVLNSQIQIGTTGRVFDLPLLGPIHISWTRVFIVTGLIITAILLFAPMITYMTISSPVTNTDYLSHIKFAKRMFECSDCTVIHPLFHWVITLVHIAPGNLEWPLAAIVGGSLFYVLTALILWRSYFLPAMKWPQTYQSKLIAAIFTLIVMLVGPITLFTLPNNQYFGYLPTNLYHNPTMSALKPFSLLLFILVIGAFTAGSRLKNKPNPFYSSLAILITTACALAKPNYVLSLIPAIVLVSAYMMVRKQKAKWPTLFTIVLMSGTILAIQMWYMSKVEGIATGTSIAPFAFFEYYQIDHLFLKFMLSILFPLVVYTAYFKKASRDFAFNFAWLVFGIGAFMTYFIAEGAGTDRVSHGNYTWSGQITLFVLFAVAAAFWLKQNYQGGFKFQINRASLICLAVLGLHLVCGLIFYVYQLFSHQNIY